MLGRDSEREAALQNEKVVAIPDLVSVSSSVHNVTSETGQEEHEQDVDMMAGIKSDFVRSAQTKLEEFYPLIFVENHCRYLLTERCATKGYVYGLGRCTTISCNILVDSLPFI